MGSDFAHKVTVFISRLDIDTKDQGYKISILLSKGYVYVRCTTSLPSDTLNYLNWNESGLLIRRDRRIFCKSNPEKICKRKIGRQSETSNLSPFSVRDD